MRGNVISGRSMRVHCALRPSDFHICSVFLASLCRHCTPRFSEYVTYMLKALSIQNFILDWVIIIYKVIINTK